jgi:hypothetical protein
MTDLLEQHIHAVVSSAEAAPDIDAVLDDVLGRAARIRRARRIRTTGVGAAVAAVIALPLLIAVDAADDPGSGSGGVEIATSPPSSGLDVPATAVPAADGTTPSTAAVADAVVFTPSLVADPGAQFEIPTETMEHVVGDPVFYRVAGTDEAVAILTSQDLRSDPPTSVDRCILHALALREFVCRADSVYGNPNANALSSFQLRPGMFGQFVADDVVGVELVGPDGTIYRAGVVEGAVLFALEPQPGQFEIRHIASDGHVVEEAAYALFPEG